MDILDDLLLVRENYLEGNPYTAKILSNASVEIIALRRQLLESERLRTHLGARIAKLAQEAINNFKPLTEEKGWTKNCKKP